MALERAEAGDGLTSSVPASLDRVWRSPTAFRALTRSQRLGRRKPGAPHRGVRPAISPMARAAPHRRRGCERGTAPMSADSAHEEWTILCSHRIDFGIGKQSVNPRLVAGARNVPFQREPAVQGANEPVLLGSLARSTTRDRPRRECSRSKRAEALERATASRNPAARARAPEDRTAWDQGSDAIQRPGFGRVTSP